LIEVVGDRDAAGDCLTAHVVNSIALIDRWCTRSRRGAAHWPKHQDREESKREDGEDRRNPKTAGKSLGLHVLPRGNGADEAWRLAASHNKLLGCRHPERVPSLRCHEVVTKESEDMVLEGPIPGLSQAEWLKSNLRVKMRAAPFGAFTLQK
jgi:hypothetical protein